MEEEDRRRDVAGPGIVKTELACLPCFFRQVLRTLHYAGVHGDEAREVVRRAEAIIEKASFDQAPARITTLLHRLLRQRTGKDPYGPLKKISTRAALAKLPEVRDLVRGASGREGAGSDRLAGGVRAAIAGNVIDFGIYDTVDLDRALRESFRLQLSLTDYEAFHRAVEQARHILYLCDNAGEIVFDRVLIEILRERGKTVTAVVKGAPVINDATLEDAASAGLADSASRVIDNGNDGIGTLWELCSDGFLEACRDADLIISKGQANFETLAEEPVKKTFFLFMVKCPVVSRWLDRKEGDIVLMEGGGSERSLLRVEDAALCRPR